jgi:hypothetical protein
VTTNPGPWWERAECSRFDPEWWSDKTAMRPTAVRICIDCPVLTPCRQEALQTGGSGVVRAGLLLIQKRNHATVISLICTHCGRRPVHMTATTRERLCGHCVGLDRISASVA